MGRDEVLIFLERISQYIGKENWHKEVSSIVEQYIKDTHDKKFLCLLGKFKFIADKNRLFEGRRLIERELENLNGVTELKCKNRKYNNRWCEVCENYNCNLNANQALKNEFNKLFWIKYIQNQNLDV